MSHSAVGRVPETTDTNAVLSNAATDAAERVPAKKSCETTCLESAFGCGLVRSVAHELAACETESSLAAQFDLVSKLF